MAERHLRDWLVWLLDMAAPDSREAFEAAAAAAFAPHRPPTDALHHAPIHEDDVVFDQKVDMIKMKQCF